jgi:signal transduction histidine kinase
MRFQRPSRIGLRILAIIVLVSSLMTAIGIVVHLALNYRADQQRLESNLELVATSALPNVSLSIWNYDYEQMQVQLEALAKLPEVSVVSIQLTEEQERRRFSLGTVDANEPVLRRDFPLVFDPPGQEPLELGELSIVSSLEPLRRDVLGQFVQILVFQGAKTFLLSAVILLLLHQMLLRHLRSLAEQAVNASVDTLDRPLGLGRDQDDELGQLVDSINVMRTRLQEDIAARIDYEAQLQAQQARADAEHDKAEILARANEELGAFSYTVSHDLRGPLRAIDGFSRVLLEDHSADLSPEAQDYLRRICAGSARLGELIDDLVSFVRLSRSSLDTSDVAMQSLAQSAWQDVAVAYADRDLRVTIDDMPNCVGDLRLIRQLWVNLFSNCCKYAHQGAAVEVHAGWTGEAYFVADRGIGFDMAYLDKIFGVFQRLHRTEEYEGTGVGLAVVKRVVERHGGRVWAESAPGEGATFYFTIGEPDALRPDREDES